MWMAAATNAATITNIPWLLGVAGSIITALIGVVGVGIRAILRGDLVPRKVVEDIEERADKWENSWNDSQATYKDLTGRLDAVTEGLRTIEKALTAVTSNTTRGRQ